MVEIIKKMEELFTLTDWHDIHIRVNCYGWTGIYGMDIGLKYWLIDSWQSYNESEIIKALDKLISEASNAPKV